MALNLSNRYFLSRLPGGLGFYAALTGARLRAADTVFTGIATHFVRSSKVPELLVLYHLRYFPAMDRLQMLQHTLEMHHPDMETTLRHFSGLPGDRSIRLSILFS